MEEKKVALGSGKGYLSYFENEVNNRTDVLKKTDILSYRGSKDDSRIISDDLSLWTYFSQEPRFDISLILFECLLR